MRLHPALSTVTGGALLGAALLLFAPSAGAGGSASVSTGAEFATAFTDGTTDEIVMTADITLPSEVVRPNNADPLVIQGNGFTLTAAPTSAMLSSNGGPVGDLTVNDLTLTGAAPAIGQAGVIFWFDGNVALDGVTLIDNVVLTTPVRLADQDNQDDEVLTVVDSTFTDNQGANGGVLRADFIEVTDSSFTSNTAGDGGGFSANLDATVTRSTFTENSATGSVGGAVNVARDLTVTDSTFSGNSASTGGGAIAGGGTATLTGSTVESNTTTSAFGQGGGINVIGDVALVNSTVSGNDASEGGGVFAVDISTTYSTVADNEATTGANLATFGGGELEAFASVVGLPRGGGENCATLTATTVEHAYEHAGSSCGFDISDAADPQLGALADNGGLTLTRLPASGSPLVGAVPVADCGGPGGTIVDDQRDVARPQGANCDIGSVEQVDEDATPPPEPPGPVPGAPAFTG